MKRLDFVRNSGKSDYRSNLAGLEKILFPFCAAENTKETTLIHGKHVRLASISGQPLILSKGRYNLRKLHELPVHLMRSERWDELKSEVLCNFHWLSIKITARSLR